MIWNLEYLCRNCVYTSLINLFRVQVENKTNFTDIDGRIVDYVCQCNVKEHADKDKLLFIPFIGWLPCPNGFKVKYIFDFMCWRPQDIDIFPEAYQHHWRCLLHIRIKQYFCKIKKASNYKIIIFPNVLTWGLSIEWHCSSVSCLNTLDLYFNFRPAIFGVHRQ